MAWAARGLVRGWIPASTHGLIECPAVARHGIFLAPFDELADARLVAELAAEAEAAGWDGFFVWDHIDYYAPVRALADPWVTLAAVAVATERLTIGTLVTPVARRRPHQLARETATLDRLSGGRLVLGIGLGSDKTGEFAPERFGEEGDAKARAKLLDDGLERLLAYWDGEFEPRPVHGRIPIWVATHWPHRRPLRRAARHDGLFPIDMPGPEALAELRGELGEGYEYVVTNRAGTDPAPWIEAGATWCLVGFSAQPSLAEVREAIRARQPAAGPRP
jgi:alkanesulfonate monooxygenase SsuD/methylene tetrahydromethanopterin reductase-like flavin-dependent oxidoreductase (luciferase family)